MSVTQLESKQRSLLFLCGRWNRTGEDAFQRRAQFLFCFGPRKRLAWQHLVALRGIVDKYCFHSGDLLQVGHLESFHHILV